MGVRLVAYRPGEGNIPRGRGDSSSRELKGETKGGGRHGGRRVGEGLIRASSQKTSREATLLSIEGGAKGTILKKVLFAQKGDGRVFIVRRGERVDQ